MLVPVSVTVIVVLVFGAVYVVVAPDAEESEPKLVAELASVQFTLCVLFTTVAVNVVLLPAFVVTGPEGDMETVITGADTVMFAVADFAGFVVLAAVKVTPELAAPGAV